MTREATLRDFGEAHTPPRNPGVVTEAPHFADLVEAFTAHLGSRGLAPATVRCRRQGLRPLGEFLAARGIDDVRQLGRGEVDVYLAWLRDRGLSPRTVEVWIVALRRFFDFLCETNRILLSPAEHVRQKNLGHLIGPTLTTAECERLLGAPNTSLPMGVRDRALIELLYTTGMRREEAARLEVFDVDLAGGLVRIGHAKGGRERVVPLGAEAAKWLRVYLERVRPVLARRAGREGHALLLGRSGDALTGAGVAMIVYAAGRKAGLRTSCHALRRTMATEMLRGGADLASVARLLGHVSAKTTQRYTKLVAADLSAAHARHHPRGRRDGRS